METMDDTKAIEKVVHVFWMKVVVLLEMLVNTTAGILVLLGSGFQGTRGVTDVCGATAINRTLVSVHHVRSVLLIAQAWSCCECRTEPNWFKICVKLDAFGGICWPDMFMEDRFQLFLVSGEVFQAPQTNEIFQRVASRIIVVGCVFLELIERLFDDGFDDGLGVVVICQILFNPVEFQMCFLP